MILKVCWDGLLDTFVSALTISWSRLLACVQSGPKGHFTLWPKIKWLSISINQIARNQEFSLSTLHTMAKVQRPPKFKILLFEEGDGLSKKVWVGREWKPKLWLRGHWFLLIKKLIINKILAVRLEGLL
jgi:hypothetical protein